MAQELWEQGGDTAHCTTDTKIQKEHNNIHNELDATITVY